MTRVDGILVTIIIAAVVLLAGTFFFPAWLLSTVVTVIAKALVAIGVVLLIRCGLVSFGQGLYYCVGGYVVGLGSQLLNVSDIFVLILLAIVAGLISGVVIGKLICRYREIFFAMFTLAIAMILYGVISQSQSLGSTDGFNVATPTALGIELTTRQAHLLLYVIACVMAAVLAAIIHLYFKSDIGYSSVAAKENEIRLEYLGSSPVNIFYGNYVIASVLGSMGGALTALNYGHVGPDMSYWTQSGEFLFIAIIGGSGSVLAAFLGSALFESVRSYALELVPDAWQLILGLVLLLIISFLPNGIWSILNVFGISKNKKDLNTLGAQK